MDNHDKNPAAADDCLLLYRQYHDRLVRFLTRLTRCPQRAEDLAQAAWLKLLASRAATGDRAMPARGVTRAYLFAVARNTFLDEYTRKHEAVRTRSMPTGELECLADVSSGDASPEQDVEREQLRSLVRTALTALPPEQQVVIDLWLRGTSIRDMAARTRAPVDTVLSRKKYAMNHLRRRLAGLEAGARERPRGLAQPAAQATRGGRFVPAA